MGCGPCARCKPQQWDGSTSFADRSIPLTTRHDAKKKAAEELCEQNTLTRHIFLCLRACLIMSHTTLAQGVSARHTIHVSCACVFDLSSTLSSHSSFVSHIFHFVLLIFLFIFHLDRFGVITPLCASANEESGPFGQQRHSHRLWAQLLRRPPQLWDHWNFHPGVIQRHQALVPAWLGDQWRHHRQSALFTTVHSGARRFSDP